MTCKNWTSSTEGSAMVGHHDRQGLNTEPPALSWNASHPSRGPGGGCTQPDLKSTGGDGLIRWTEQDRAIADTDIVFWYTFGHTHLPRPEDYPVMPTAYIGFMLKPAGFFTANPANDVPPSPKKTTAGSCCGAHSQVGECLDHAGRGGRAGHRRARCDRRRRRRTP